MEKVEIKAITLVSYSLIFPSGKANLKEILKIIPSKRAIEWASYMLSKKSSMTIFQNDCNLFKALLPLVNDELRANINGYLNNIMNILDYAFINEVALLILIESLLENHNDSEINGFCSEDDFSNMIIAYLLCCDEMLKITHDELGEIKSTDPYLDIYLPEQLKYNDIYYPKDPRVEFLKFYYFMSFCEGNEKFKNYLELFLKENNIDKWDEYLYFVFETCLSLATNPKGCTNKQIKPDFHYGKKYLDSMSVDTKSFRRDKDFRCLRSKPVYYQGNNAYSILSMGFFIDKMYQGFLFDLASVLKKYESETKIDSYPDLKKLLGEPFTEEFLFYKIMNGCFENNSEKLISGKELKQVLNGGEPDFYMRKGRDIFLFECKDSMLDAKTKHCGDIEQIRMEISQLFVLSTIDKNKGKQKDQPQAKGVTQLLNVIADKLDVIIQKIDKIEVIDRFNIYPIIVYNDSSFDIEGIEYMLNTQFKELQQTRDILDVYLVKQLVMIPLELMIQLEDYFKDGRLELDDLINKYIIECNQSEQDKRLPFHRFLRKKSSALGYAYNNSSRFKEVLNFMVQKNKV